MREPKKLIVKVYRNLHLDGVMWSVRGPDDKILMHAKSVLLKNATFIVQPAGREKVRREKKKTVHAFVKGELVIDPNEIARANFDRTQDKYSMVSYNPYKDDEFVVIAETNPPYKEEILEDRPAIKSAEQIIIKSVNNRPKLLAIGVTTE